ncbi:MAG TPA: hypothetical protein VJM07_06910 [Gaiella sp.]|nr:hypothetical protein [Gaiella sp.]
MSEPNRRRKRGLRAGRGTFTAAALLLAGAAAVATLTTTAAARSTATPSNVSPPTIAGVVEADQTVTAAPGSWTGTPPLSFAFQWQRCDATGAGCAAIAGATAQTYAIVAGDIGSTLRVSVTATNGEGSSAAESNATPVVTAQLPPVNVGEPVISGTPVAGATLTSSTGVWNGTSIAYAYQWVRCGPDGGLPDGSNCPTVAGATSSSYTLGADDIGRRLRVQVVATNDAGTAAAGSNATAIVTESTTTGPPRNLAEPSISGTPAVGRSLVAGVGTWAGQPTLTYAYQWVRCDAGGGLPDGSDCTPITGATTSSLVPTSDDAGRSLRVRVTASNGLGTLTVASNATAAIQASSSTTPVAQAPRNTILPSIFGSPTVGGTLTVTPGVWTGTAPLLYAYQWLRCDADGGVANGSGCDEIGGATGTQYRPAATDVGRRLRAEVTARNNLGTHTEISSATAQVQAAGTTPTRPANLPPGAVRLRDGKYSIPVTSVSPPQRLRVATVAFTPRIVRSRARPLAVRVRVLDTRGYAVRGALVLARSTPRVTSAPREVPTARDGWVRIAVRPRASFPLGKRVALLIRARKQSDGSVAGVSNQRRVRVPTSR